MSASAAPAGDPAAVASLYAAVRYAGAAADFLRCCGERAGRGSGHMFATKYGQDTHLSVNLVSLSTLFSIATMPLIVSLAEWFA